MVNNKMYILQSNKCITQEQKDAFVGRFNLVFNQALQEYDIGALTPEDIQKITKSMNQTKSKESNKINIEKTINESEKEETIGQTKNEKQVQHQSQRQGFRETRLGTMIEPNSYLEHLQPISEQKQNKLSLKQRVAQFLQKNHIFMNLSFVENFVHQQLDVLPSAQQETMETNTSTVNRSKTSFMDELTNFGEYRNLPPVQSMSDPEKVKKLQEKMEKKQPSTGDGEITN